MNQDEYLDPSISKDQSCKDPAHNAMIIIQEAMLMGSSKDGCNESWRDKPKKFHREKAIRHLLTAQMIEDGVIEPDGENHDHLGLTRASLTVTTKHR